MSLLLSATGPTPVGEVWDRYVAPERWPDWAPQIRSVSCSGPFARGTSGTVHGPWPTRIPFEIRSVDASARQWSWRVGVGPLGVVMDHGVEESGTGARAWVRIHAPAVLVAPYAPIARLALRRLVG